MGNLVADAMRSRYAGLDAVLTNSGSLRADLRCAPPSAGEPPCAITLGEVTVDYIGARSPVGTVVEGRIVRP